MPVLMTLFFRLLSDVVIMDSADSKRRYMEMISNVTRREALSVSVACGQELQLREEINNIL